MEFAVSERVLQIGPFTRSYRYGVSTTIQLPGRPAFSISSLGSATVVTTALERRRHTSIGPVDISCFTANDILEKWVVLSLRHF